MILAKKGRQFIWGEEKQTAFKETERRLQEPPVIHFEIIKADFIYFLTLVKAE